MAGDAFIKLRGNSKDITGHRFTRLAVNGPVARGAGGQIYWRCQCDCGNIVDVLGVNLRHGRTHSCGCYMREVAATINYSHGQSSSNLYWIWRGMLARCYDANTKVYKDYGGRGISVHPEWLGQEGFLRFAAHMGPRPSLNHSIERVDVNGPYSPDNCCWATRAEQMVNRRDTVRVEYNGETLPLQTLCRKLGLNHSRVDRRLRAGWPLKEALERPFVAHKDRNCGRRKKLER